MPTSRPRHTITETPEIAAALEAAARRWPDDETSRSRLLIRLVEQGRRAIEADAQAARAQRLETIEQVAGAATGMYDEGYLDRLREDWPE